MWCRAAIAAKDAGARRRGVRLGQHIRDEDSSVREVARHDPRAPRDQETNWLLAQVARGVRDPRRREEGLADPERGDRLESPRGHGQDLEAALEHVEPLSEGVAVWWGSSARSGENFDQVECPVGFGGVDHDHDMVAARHRVHPAVTIVGHAALNSRIDSEVDVAGLGRGRLIRGASIGKMSNESTAPPTRSSAIAGLIRPADVASAVMASTSGSWVELISAIPTQRSRPAAV